MPVGGPEQCGGHVLLGQQSGRGELCQPDRRAEQATVARTRFGRADGRCLAVAGGYQALRSALLVESLVVVIGRPRRAGRLSSSDALEGGGLMAEFFQGRWRATVTGRNAGFSQRVLVSGGASGNGAYNGVVGNSFEFSDAQVELQWNNESGSGWQPSAVTSSVGMSSPLVIVRFISADDNFPDERDGDFDDLQVAFECLDAPFAVDLRPFAVERGSKVMLPDGIFDTSQGVQYMGVRVRNSWFFDWQSQFPATGMKIGIAPASRTSLAARGIVVRDDWQPRELEAFGQAMDDGFVRVPELDVGESTTVYFKVDVSVAAPSKPDFGFVAQRDAFDPRYDEPSRLVHKRIFISRSSFDPLTKELVCEVPEGRLRVRFTSMVLDLKAADDAAKDLIRCLEKTGTGRRGGPGPDRPAAVRDAIRSWWQSHPGDAECRRRSGALLRRLLEELQAGKDPDLCALDDLLSRCCKGRCNSGQCGGGDDCCGGGGHGDGDGAGWGDGTGVDGWCRVDPVGWLPLSFDYRVEPDPAYAGQFGPMPFEDPWWKALLIILAVLLEIASLIYDYVEAGQDPRFIIGEILRNGDATTNAIDCAVSSLNGSRGVDLGEEDAQNDDVNNTLPIEGLDGIIMLDRTDNGTFGVRPAVVGNTVWKSGGRSGTTRGTVTSVTYATNVPYDTEDTITGTVNFTNQVLITQITGMEQPVSQAGDSGSVWVDMASKRPVALNFAGDTEDVGDTGVGNPILDVVNRLDIRFSS
jgi:hypothetical protein